MLHNSGETDVMLWYQPTGHQPIESAEQLFEVRDGMEGEHMSEIDLARHHHDLEEGEWLESSVLICTFFFWLASGRRYLL